MESAGIPDLRDFAQVHVSPANVNSGSHATNTNTEEADAVRVRRSSLRSVDGLGHKVRSNRPPATVSSSESISSRTMMIYLQRVEWVNNIWIKANQCLTARVDA